MTIENILLPFGEKLCPFGIVCGHLLYIFYVLVCLDQEKSGSPCRKCNQCSDRSLNQTNHQCDQMFCDKSDQFCPNIAQNGVLRNKKIARRKLWSELGNLKTKSSKNLELI
jgi:hypothetical protein